MGVSVADLEVNVTTNSGQARDELGRYTKALDDTGTSAKKMGTDVKKGGDDAEGGLKKAGTSADDAKDKFTQLIGKINPLNDLLNGTGKSADKASGKSDNGGLGFLWKSAIALGPTLAPIGQVLGGLAVGLGGIAIAGAVGAGALLSVFKPAMTAMKGVTDAQTKLNTATQQYGAGSTQALQAQVNLDKAMIAAGPGASNMATQITNFKNAYSEWAKSFQPQVFGIMSQGIDAAGNGMKNLLTPAVNGALGGMQNLVGSFQAFATSPAVIEGFTRLGPIINQVFSALGPIITHLLEAVVNFAGAAGPLITVVLGLLDKLASWLSQIDFDRVLKPLIDSFTKLAPIVGNFFGTLLTIVGTLLTAIGPIGTAIFTILATVFTALQPVIEQFGVVIAALAPVIGQVANVLAKGLGQVIIALAPVITALLPVFLQLAQVIGGALMDAIQVIAPALASIAGVFVALIQGLGAGLKPALDGLSAFLSAITPLTFVFVPLAAGLKEMAPLFKTVGEAVGQLVGPVAAIAGLVVSFGATLLKALVPALLQLLPAVIGLIPTIAQFATSVLQILVAMTPLLPIIMKIVGALAGGLVQVVVVLLNILKPFLPVIMGIVLAFIAFQKIAAAVSIVMGLLNIVMDANPIMLIALAVLGLVVGFIALYKHSQLVRDIVADIGKVFGDVFNFIMDVVKTVVGFIKTHWELLLAILLGPIALAALFIAKHWKEISEGAKKVVEAVLGFFKKLPDELAKFFDKIWDTVWSAFKTALTWLDANVWQPVSSWFSAIPDKIASIFVGVWDVAWAEFKTVITWLETNVFQPAHKFFAELPGKIASLFVNIWDTIWADFKTIATWIYTNIDLPVINFFSSLPGKIVKFFINIWDTIWADFKNIATWLYTNVEQPVIGFFTSLPGKIGGAISGAISGVSSFGKQILNWFIDGIDEGIRHVKSATASIPGLNFITGSLPEIPHVAAMGTGMSQITGLTLVGEKGPELVNFGRPAQVFSNDQSRALLSSSASGNRSGYTLNMNVMQANSAEIAAGFRRMELMDAARAGGL